MEILHCTTTTPSTPHPLHNFYYSAPTTPIHTTFQNYDDDDFAFDCSGPLDPLLISDADELFHCGRIKTTSFSHKRNSDYFIEAFHQIPSCQVTQAQPTQKKSNSFTKTFYQTRDDKTQLTQNPLKRQTETTREKDTDCLIEAFYQTPDGQTQPTQKKSDYFIETFYQTRDDKTQLTQNPPTRRSETTTKKDSQYLIDTFYQTRGDKTQLTQNPTTREKDTNCFIETFYRTSGVKTQNPPKRTRNKPSRSSSPLRVSDILSGEDNNHKTWYNKWNLKNLLLFRSTSEGSAANKYSRIRRADGCRRKVSAHEMHYTTNRAAAEERRRKTYLPYKSGLLGCLVTRQPA
ncbi:uncharacterized protein LOC143631388 [Bidens hawaiensis]|uniref:uncharacterized protein LOC143631388 n=1 Tax=Bidens hawaiensis TaxID=980011 RepID=UPI00404AEACA